MVYHYNHFAIIIWLVCNNHNQHHRIKPTISSAPTYDSHPNESSPTAYPMARFFIPMFHPHARWFESILFYKHHPFFFWSPLDLPHVYWIRTGSSNRPIWGGS